MSDCTWSDYLDLSSPPPEWGHGWIPKTSEAALIKAKKKSGSANDGKQGKISPQALKQLSAKQRRDARAAGQAVGSAPESGSKSRFKGNTKDLSPKQRPGNLQQAKEAAVRAGLPAGDSLDPSAIREFLTKLGAMQKAATGERKSALATRRRMILTYVARLRDVSGGK